MKLNIETEFQKIADNFVNLKQSAPIIEQIVDTCVCALRTGHKIMFCGNGGSASQCQHLAAELVGRYQMERPAMNGLSLTTDTSNLTAIGNDYGYDSVFARQIEGVGQTGDVLFGLSTSGNSSNVIQAFLKAKEKGIITIALTGQKNSKMKELAEITLSIPTKTSNNIQEKNLAVGHLICGEIEKAINE